MMEPAAGLYLRDLGILLREQAVAAKRHYDAARGSHDEDVALGTVMAYHDVLSLMRDQTESFGLGAEAVGLAGFDPDAELL